MRTKPTLKIFSAKNFFQLFLFFFVFSSAYGQAGTWTWISGDSIGNSLGAFGVQGIPSVNNHPPGMYEACERKDNNGNFWIYGGGYPQYADLWKYNPVTNEWTWIKGNGSTNQSTIF